MGVVEQETSEMEVASAEGSDGSKVNDDTQKSKATAMKSEASSTDGDCKTLWKSGKERRRWIAAVSRGCQSISVYT